MNDYPRQNPAYRLTYLFILVNTSENKNLLIFYINFILLVFVFKKH